MTKLRLAPLGDDRPVKLTVEIPAPVFRDLKCYAEVLAKTAGAAPSSAEPSKLIVPMLVRFMASDRAFSKLRKSSQKPVSPAPFGSGG